MGTKPGHKRINCNIPETSIEVLKKRAAAEGSNVSAVINSDIDRGNQKFTNSQA